MSKVKILYLDKQSESNEILNNLLDNGYEVRLVNLIYDAKTQILSEDYDLIISEIDFDDGNGLDFIKEIKQKYNIKTIVVSANKEPQHLLKAIEIKVDKYLTKPVDARELESSVNNLLSIKDNDINNTMNNFVELGNGFTYDVQLQKLKRENDKHVDLTNQESNLLKVLIQQKNSYCSHEILQNAIGVAGEATTIETLRTVIKKIRKKTYEDIIINLSGVGYKIDIKTESKKQDISALAPIKIINKKVLIVKGNEKRNSTLKMKLSQYGLECEQVFLLAEAKEAIKYQSFDYVIVDLQLPDGDGAELIRVKKEPGLNKIIVLSNSEDMHYKEYLYFKGIVDYIEKRDDLDYLAYSIYQTILKVESNHIYNHILVVESSKKIAEQIKDILLPRNYKVDVIGSSAKVMDLLKHKSYNMIILDLELDGINSLEFLISLKKEVNQALPIIMLSSSNRSYSLVRECYVKGAVECLRKPIFAEEFILKVDQWTEFYKQTLEIADKHRLLASYQTIIDNTTIVSKTDAKGVITYANKMFCAISGYSKDELIGKPHNIVRHPQMRASVFKNMWDVISKEKKIWHGILKNRKKDGTEYIVFTYIMPILDYNNEVVEYIALRNDITEIKNINSEILKI